MLLMGLLPNISVSTTTDDPFTWCDRTKGCMCARRSHGTDIGSDNINMSIIWLKLREIQTVKLKSGPMTTGPLHGAVTESSPNGRRTRGKTCLFSHAIGEFFGYPGWASQTCVSFSL